MSSVLLPPLRSLFTDADVASLIELRRDLHQHPELSWKEERTAGRLTDAVTALGAVDIARVAGTGVAAHYYGPEAAEGFFHTFSGWILFVVAFVMLFTIQKVLSTWHPPSRLRGMRVAEV